MKDIKSYSKEENKKVAIWSWAIQKSSWRWKAKVGWVQKKNIIKCGKIKILHNKGLVDSPEKNFFFPCWYTFFDLDESKKLNSINIKKDDCKKMNNDVKWWI